MIALKKNVYVLKFEEFSVCQLMNYYQKNGKIKIYDIYKHSKWNYEWYITRRFLSDLDPSFVSKHILILHKFLKTFDLAAFCHGWGCSLEPNKRVFWNLCIKGISFSVASHGEPQLY